MSKVASGYSTLQIALHWIVAFLIAGAFLSHENMGRALRQRIEQDMNGFDGATWHTILGGAAFLFIVIRLVTRALKGAPDPTGPEKVQLATKWGHRSLYILMLLAPALGAATWYGHIQSLGDIHGLLGQILVIAAAGHVVVALLHQALWSDGTLMRMFQPGTK